MLVSGCSNYEPTNESKQEVKQNNEQTADITQNEELMKQEEEGVLDGQVYGQNNNANWLWLFHNPIRIK